MPSNTKTAGTENTAGFSKEEKAAMKERARELKAEARASQSRAEGEAAVLARLAEMPEPDRSMGERIHAIVQAIAPELAPRLWYGMPAYARDGKIIFFFQDAQKFKARYATLGFSDAANLDDGNFWPNAYALTALTDTDAEKIAALIKKALG